MRHDLEFGIPGILRAGDPGVTCAGAVGGASSCSIAETGRTRKTARRDGSSPSRPRYCTGVVTLWRIRNHPATPM